MDSHRGWTHIGDGFVWGDLRVLYYLLYPNPPVPLYSHPIQPWLAGCGKGGSFGREGEACGEQKRCRYEAFG